MRTAQVPDVWVNHSSSVISVSVATKESSSEIDYHLSSRTLNTEYEEMKSHAGSEHKRGMHTRIPTHRAIAVFDLHVDALGGAACLTLNIIGTHTYDRYDRDHRRRPFPPFSYVLRQASPPN